MTPKGELREVRNNGVGTVRGRETSKGERDRKRYEGIGRGTEEEYNGLEVE